MAHGLGLLDVVALVEALPGERLQRGHVGTIVELPAPDVYEGEFSDSEGRAHAFAALRADQLLPLCHKPAAAH